MTMSSLDEMRAAMILDDHGSDEAPGMIVMCRGQNRCEHYGTAVLNCPWCMRIYPQDPRGDAELRRDLDRGDC